MENQLILSPSESALSVQKGITVHSSLNEWMLGCFTGVWLFATLWTVPNQAPLSMRFFRQEYWSGLPFPSPRDLHPQGLHLCLLHFLNWQVGSLPREPPGKPQVGHMRWTCSSWSSWTTTEDPSEFNLEKE